LSSRCADSVSSIGTSAASHADRGRYGQRDAMPDRHCGKVDEGVPSGNRADALCQRWRASLPHPPIPINVISGNARCVREQDEIVFVTDETVSGCAVAAARWWRRRIDAVVGAPSVTVSRDSDDGVPSEDLAQRRNMEMQVLSSTTRFSHTRSRSSSLETR
jgi:hypothetical protein